MKILVINGPNLNMLGIREPALYGNRSYDALLSLIGDHCKKRGVEVEFFQSNHEGALVDRIQEAYGNVDGIVMNPAAYTHTSVALLDALKAVAIPTVEVHHRPTCPRARISVRFPMCVRPASPRSRAAASTAISTRSTF